MIQGIFFCFVLLFNIIENDDCFIYYNTDDEVLILDDTNISYRLRNKGGLISFSYYTGSFEKRGKKYILGNDQNLYTNVESSKLSEPNPKGISICMHDENGNALAYAPIVFGQLSGLKQREYYSNDSGCIFLKEDTSASIIKANFNCLMIGNSFSTVLELRNGYDYTITLKVLSKYGIQNTKEYRRKCLKLIQQNQNHMRLFDDVTNSWKHFVRLEDNSSCRESIFTIEF